MLVEYPRTGLWTLGFLAGNVPREDEATPSHSIFVPTAPNPTTGFMLIVPPEQLRPTELRVEEALKMIVSAGVVCASGPLLFPPKLKRRYEPFSCDFRVLSLFC